MRAIHAFTAGLVATFATASGGCMHRGHGIVATNAPDSYRTNLNEIPRGASESTGSEGGRGGGPSEGSSYTDGMPIGPAGEGAPTAPSATSSPSAAPTASSSACAAPPNANAPPYAPPNVRGGR